MEVNAGRDLTSILDNASWPSSEVLRSLLRAFAMIARISASVFGRVSWATLDAKAVTSVTMTKKQLRPFRFIRNPSARNIRKRLRHEISRPRVSDATLFRQLA